MFSISNHELRKITDRFGTPAYVYDLDHIRERVQALRQALPSFEISYAMKANPNPALLRAMLEIVDGLDVSSGGEVELAGHTGWAGAKLSFTGPAKRDDELRRAVGVDVAQIVVESVAEARRLNAIAQAKGKVQSVIVRISPSKVAPGFGARMSGKPTQFGIDEEVIDGAIEEILAMPGLRLDGMHVYVGSQCLNIDAIAEHFASTFAMCDSICTQHDLSPSVLIIGSGFGIPYHDGDRELDLVELGKKITQAVDRLKKLPRFEKTRLVLETGRFIVGQAGCLLTRVVATKQSRGMSIAMCDGGMNQHLAAAGHLGSVIHRNYPIFKIADDLPPTQSWRPQLVYGPLCTSIDLLGNQIKLPPLEAGDVLGVASSGAYGLTSSPVHFISHSPAREILCHRLDGEMVSEEVSWLRRGGGSLVGG